LAERKTIHYPVGSSEFETCNVTQPATSVSDA